MKKILMLCLLLALSSRAFCQGTDNDLIKKTIGNLFDSMREDDTTSFKDLFANTILVQHVISKNDTTSNVITDNPADYLKQIGAYKKDAWDEQITRYDDINVGNGMAIVWASYKFYSGKNFDHCGITIFQMIKRKEHWKIVSIFYSIKTSNCPD